MCGFAATFMDAGGVDGRKLALALRSIGHRGPDSSEIWLADDGRAGMGHARLAITGGDSGAQPLADEARAIHAVVNGEFYGFEAIRTELERAGHVFRTASDSEILIHLYQDLGTDCVARLRGEFAFVLWDAARDRVFACRDRFGIKPLFYASDGASISFASEIKALFALGLQAAWNPDAFLQHIFMIHGQSETLFKEVSQVPPGHFLEVRHGRVKLQRYWDLEFPVSDALYSEGTDEDAIVEYRTRLLEAVRLRTRSEAPVGCYLSGGIDSSSVMTMAASLAARQLKAFTVSFDAEPYDEAPLAKLVARHAGAEYHALRLTQNDLADALSDAVFHVETLGNLHGVARYLQSRSARDAGCKVALTGDGADETLAGYSHFRLDVSGQSGGSVPALLSGVQAALGFVPAWVVKLAVDRAPFHGLVSDYAASLECYGHLYDRFIGQVDVQRACRGRHPVQQSLYLWCKTILPNYSLCADRLEMAFSIEGRHPYLDHELFEYVRHLPPRLLLRDGQEKYVLREAARPFVPPDVYARRKHPFAAPPVTIDLGGPVMTLLQDELRGGTMKNVPFFEQQAIVALLDELPELAVSRRMALEPLLLMLLCTCFLHERYSL